MRRLPVACVGGNGHQVLDLLAGEPRARLVGYAEVPGEVISRVRESSPEVLDGAKEFPGIEGLARDSGAELVSVCSGRRDGQAAEAAAILAAGASVYAEKPLATSLADLDALEEAARASSGEIRSMTGMIYNPSFGAMRGLVASGRLGRVVQVSARKSYPCHDRRPQDEGVDGGLLAQAGVHAVGFVRYVTGLEFGEVSARETGLGNPGQGGLRMAAEISATLTGGALCSIVVNYLNPRGIGFWGNDGLRVFGTRGMAEATDGLTRARVALGEEPPRDLPVAAGDSGGYAALFSDYVGYLLARGTDGGDGRAMLLSQADSFENTRVVLRARCAARRADA